jgi:hypothetical protein
MCGVAATPAPLSLRAFTAADARDATEPALRRATAGPDPRGRDKTLRDVSSRATKAFYLALSLCDLVFSGVFERHPRLTLAIVESRAGSGRSASPPPRGREWSHASPVGTIAAVSTITPSRTTESFTLQSV